MLYIATVYYTYLFIKKFVIKMLYISNIHLKCTFTYKMLMYVEVLEYCNIRILQHTDNQFDGLKGTWTI